MSGNGSPKRRSAGIAAALTQAALALPAVAAAEPQADYLFSSYQEEDLPRDRLGAGSAERYDIRSHLFRVVAPRGDDRYGLNLTYEVMSGASPWYVTPDTDRKPIQQMSGASIREERIAADASATLGFGRTALTLLAGVSDEDDYESVSGGLGVEHTGQDSAVTWSAGARHSADRLKPTQGATATGTTGDDKSVTSAYASVAVVLDPRTVIQLGGSLAASEGYLSDPYKQVYVEDLGAGVAGTRFDSRPDERMAWTATGKLRRHYTGPDGALHLDYRYYRDDWELESHTTTLGWHQRVAVDWVVVPSVRFYSQGAAAFYSPWFAEIPDDGFMSSDYRLSPFGALALRLDADGSIGGLGLGFGIEHYDADVRYANGPDTLANPGLVEATSYHAKVRYRF